MNRDQRPTSPSATPNAATPKPFTPDEAWPLLPVETEVYILPDGQVVIADLPAELAEHLGRWGIRTAENAAKNSESCTPPLVAGDAGQPKSVDCAGDSG